MKRYLITWQERGIMKSKEFSDTTMTFLNLQRLLNKGVEAITIKVIVKTKAK